MVVVSTNSVFCNSHFFKLFCAIQSYKTVCGCLHNEYKCVCFDLTMNKSYQTVGMLLPFESTPSQTLQC